MPFSLQTRPRYTSQNFVRETAPIGSPDMNVNGSITPVDFFFRPAGNETWLVEDFSLSLLDKGVWTISTFGAEPTLPNGVQLIVKSQGKPEYELLRMMSNSCMARFFLPHTLFGLKDEHSIGDLHMDDWLKIEGNEGDYIKVRIEDDLTLIGHLRMSLKAWRTQK